MKEENYMRRFILKHATVERVVRIVGVYFLLDEDEIVYIGKSTNIHGRIDRHARDKNKIFTKWTYLICSHDDLELTETKYIRMFDPKYNRAKSPTYLKSITGKRKRPMIFEYNGRFYEDMDVTYEHQKSATELIGGILRGSLGAHKTPILPRLSPD